MIKCWIDGSISENPGGKMGIAVIIRDGDDTIFRLHKEYPAKVGNSVNVCEYLALQECLKWLIENGYSKEEIHLFSDSQMLVNQVIGKWKIKPISEGERYNKKTKKREFYSSVNSYYPYAKDVFDNQLDELPFMSFFWIPRLENMEADALSKIRGLEVRKEFEEVYVIPTKS